MDEMGAPGDMAIMRIADCEFLAVWPRRQSVGGRSGQPPGKARAGIEIRMDVASNVSSI